MHETVGFTLELVEEVAFGGRDPFFAGNWEVTTLHMEYSRLPQVFCGVVNTLFESYVYQASLTLSVM